MLRIVDKPLIQYAVEDVYDAGIGEMIFVNVRHKRAIEDHFDTAFELQVALGNANKNALLQLVPDIKPSDVTCFYVRKPRPLGLGHAVLFAEPLIGHDPFAVLLATDLMVADPSIMRQLVEAYTNIQSSVIAAQNAPPLQTNRCGMVDVLGLTDTLLPQEGLVEKPDPSVAPSTLAVAGRYVLSGRVFKHIGQKRRCAGGEIQLTDGIASMLSEEPVYALRYQGRRYDCGTQAGLLKATVDLALARSDVGATFRQYLKNSVVL
jgi:UTP--glucose-1-phosphate uridylyltransferase